MKIIITKIIKKIKNAPGPSLSSSPPSTYSSDIFLQIEGGDVKDAQNSAKISSPKNNINFTN